MSTVFMTNSTSIYEDLGLRPRTFLQNVLKKIPRPPFKRACD